MSRISLVIRDPSSSDYTSAKLRELRVAEAAAEAAFAPTQKVVPLSEDALQARVQESIEEDPGTSPPLSGVSFGEGLRRLVRERVAKRSPFLKDEHPLSENGDFARLSENWGRFRKGAIVWTQKTNQACCHYIFDHTVPSPLAARQSDVSLATAGPSISSYDFASWSLKLAVGLCGKYAPDYGGPVSEVGAFLLGLLFPPQDTAQQTRQMIIDIMNDVVAQIEKIVKETAAQQSLKDANDHASNNLTAFQHQITDDYARMKADAKVTLKDLCAYMSDRRTYCENEILSCYNNQNVAVAGVGNLMVAAGLLLAIFQEAALVDPNHQDDRYQGQYSNDVIDYAKIYADYVDDLLPGLCTARAQSVVSPPKYHETKVPSQGGYSCSAYYDSQDKYDPDHPVTITGGTQTWGEIPGGGSIGDSETALEKYNKVLADYNQGLFDELKPYVQAVTSQWRLLIWDPVPSNYQLSGKRTILWNVHLDDSFAQPGDHSAQVVVEPSSNEVLVFKAAKGSNGSIEFSIIYEEAGLTSICRFYSGARTPRLSYEERGRRVGLTGSSAAVCLQVIDNQYPDQKAEVASMAASFLARPINWDVHLGASFKTPGDTSGSTPPLDPSPEEVIVFRSQKDADNEILFSIVYDTPGLTSICRFYSAGKVTSEMHGPTVGLDASSTADWPADPSNSIAAFFPKDYRMSGERIVNWQVYLGGTFKIPGISSGSTRSLYPSPEEVVVFRCPKEAGTEIVFSIIYDTSGLTSICRFYSNGSLSSEGYGQRVGPDGSSTGAWAAYPYNNMVASFAPEL